MGKYIYFNSTRTGLMQVYGMKPDGSQQEQVVTNDEYATLVPRTSLQMEMELSSPFFLKDAILRIIILLQTRLHRD